jgi:transcriptional regulator with XRE-family HTH domain
MTPDPPPIEASALLVEHLLAAVGGVTTLSRLVGVTPGQVSRWRRGSSRPGPGNAALLQDLQEVLTQARRVWNSDQLIVDWLTGANAHLGGATPASLIRHHRTQDVLDAIDDDRSGAYA